jgi:hypothetical protein
MGTVLDKDMDRDIATDMDTDLDTYVNKDMGMNMNNYIHGPWNFEKVFTVAELCMSKHRNGDLSLNYNFS